MSDSLWFSRIFTLQSFSWFCFIYSFWLFLRFTYKKIITRVRNVFITIEFWNFSKFPFQFFIFNIYYFKITSNSFIYSLVEQFLVTHFHKNNYRGKGVYFWGKNLPNFSDLYTPYLGWRKVYYTSNILNLDSLQATVFDIL